MDRRRREASRKGALARMKLYGNIGTPEGRRLGGLRSLQTHKKLQTRFKVLKKFSVPGNSEKFAELLGIIAGDGHIDVYQTSITTHAVTDLEHAKYTKALIEKLFPITASLAFRSSSQACVVTINSKDIGDILVAKGMKRGNKISGGLSMPDWIRTNSRFKKAFVRGLFDSDGSVYIDVHHIRGCTYKNIGMAFANRSLPLLADFKATLEEVGLRPTQTTKYQVFLRRASDIEKYFQIIGSSNPKHLGKVCEYLTK